VKSADEINIGFLFESMEEKTRLTEILQGLIGKEILKVGAGGSTGSIFSLDIGEKLIKEESTDNIFFKGEWGLMVYCAWRLYDTKNQKPITGWHEDSELNGAMTLGLKSLLKDVVENVSVSSTNDLEIYFKSGKKLDVFCDLTTHIDAEANWFLGTHGKFYSINNSLSCIVEEK